ncbi:MAG TPA: acyl-CoA dehydrogenase family protein [Acidimicrobiales bacterium]|nr:acyl-CoA dehydrogenase family protein [Acidimicrobiales bacterium]
MTGWTEEQQEFRRVVRRFVEAEVAPRRTELELGDLPPYGVLRSYYAAFGLGDAALDRFRRASARRADGPGTGAADRSPRSSAAEVLIPMIELSRWCPGLVTALGVSVGLAAGTILRSGSAEQRERWAPPLLTLEKVGAWAITEPDSGSDAFGSMRTVARPDGDGFVLNGSKTFITNGPYADTLVVICKLDDGRPPKDREVLTFVLDRGMPGLAQSGPLRKLGLHSSPTGEVSLADVRVGADRLLRSSAGGDAKAQDGVRANFATERAGVAAMALGVIERCLELAVDYARDRVQFGRRIGDFQLVQLKLADMEVARLNVENLVLGYIAMADAGRRPSLAEASAMKLYSARAAVDVASAAVQVFGGNGYMAENHVEQLYRDARVFQIYGGTDEIQVTHIARDLLR